MSGWLAALGLLAQPVSQTSKPVCLSCLGCFAAAAYR